MGLPAPEAGTTLRSLGERSGHMGPPERRTGVHVWTQY